jgi:hypothetical protein
MGDWSNHRTRTGIAVVGLPDGPMVEFFDPDCSPNLYE